ncbi:MAG: hypothetical protein ACRD12_03885 [Acidimicrobiales bacterium]
MLNDVASIAAALDGTVLAVRRVIEVPCESNEVAFAVECDAGDALLPWQAARSRVGATGRHPVVTWGMDTGLSWLATLLEHRRSWAPPSPTDERPLWARVVVPDAAEVLADLGRGNAPPDLWEPPVAPDAPRPDGATSYLDWRSPYPITVALLPTPVSWQTLVYIPPSEGGLAAGSVERLTAVVRS